MERDYVLGTDEEELERLGLQHRVWRSVVLECWQRSGITVGKRILDVGAGPGYATRDLAEIVGPTGEVVALERSHNFVHALEQVRGSRGLTNVKIYERDLMTDEWPGGSFDFSWCRWVAAFVSDPNLLIEKLARAIRPGGRAIFHEYGHYETWSFLPSLPKHERFRSAVIATWRSSGGEPNAAQNLPALLSHHGFVIRSATPHIFCLRPRDYMWQWPLTFIHSYLPRLIETGVVDKVFADEFCQEIEVAAADPNCRMLTPLVVELIAEKLNQ